jgi:cytochrome c-type biogenesis protein CcmH/NrfG
MGPIGMPELIVILIVLLVIPAGIIAALWCLTSRSKTTPPSGSRASIQERLTEIDSLRAQNLISEAEYEEKRIEILSSI